MTLTAQHNGTAITRVPESDTFAIDAAAQFGGTVYGHHNGDALIQFWNSAQARAWLVECE